EAGGLARGLLDGRDLAEEHRRRRPLRMKRLYLTVEGQTEQAFAKEVLTPHLASFQVFLEGSRLTGTHQRRGGRIPKGGLTGTFGHALNDIKRWLKEDQSPDVRFSMMVDLYGLPTDFPGYATAIILPTGQQQAIALQQALAEEIGDPRFIPYVQVHEFEALVLVEPRRIASLYENREAAIDSLCLVCDDFKTPEDINHGRQSHPKYRIQQAVPDYHENAAGPLIVEQIGLAALRKQCPHFGQWLTTLEQLDS
ncbi:MAG: DUF4276 family protein, partial [Gemmataceae bacterium]